MSTSTGIGTVGAASRRAVGGPGRRPIDEAVATAGDLHHGPVRGPPRDPEGGHLRRGGGPVRQPPAHRGRPRGGQDRPGPGPGHRPRGPAVPGPGPPRPAALRRHRGDRLLPGHRHLGVPARPGLRPRGPARRAQPDAAPHPVGPARGHGGAAGVGGRRVVAAAPAPPGHRHPEPDRPARHLPAGGEPARPVRRRPPPSAIPTPRSRPAWSCTAAAATPSTPWPRWPTRPSGDGPSTPPPRCRWSPPVAEYAVSLVRATRTAGTVRLGRQPPGGHLAHPQRPGLCRAVRPGLRHPPGHPGGGGGLPGPPADRRGRRRRRPGPGRPDHRRDTRPPT